MPFITEHRTWDEPFVVRALTAWPDGATPSDVGATILMADLFRMPVEARQQALIASPRTRFVPQNYIGGGEPRYFHDGVTLQLRAHEGACIAFWFGSLFIVRYLPGYIPFVQRSLEVLGLTASSSEPTSNNSRTLEVSNPARRNHEPISFAPDEWLMITPDGYVWNVTSDVAEWGGWQRLAYDVPLHPEFKHADPWWGLLGISRNWQPTGVFGGTVSTRPPRKMRKIEALPLP